MDGQNDQHRRDHEKDSKIAAIALEDTGHLNICTYHDDSHDKGQNSDAPQTLLFQAGFGLADKKQGAGDQVKPEKSART